MENYFIRLLTHFLRFDSNYFESIQFNYIRFSLGLIRDAWQDGYAIVTIENPAINFGSKVIKKLGSPYINSTLQGRN